MVEVDVVRLNSQALVELFNVFLLFFLVTATRFVVLFDSFDFILFVLGAVDEVEFVDLSLAEQSKVVFLALVVNAVELCETTVGPNHVRVP